MVIYTYDANGEISGTMLEQQGGGGVYDPLGANGAGSASAGVLGGVGAGAGLLAVGGAGAAGLLEARLVHPRLTGPSFVCQPAWPSFMDTQQPTRDYVR
jgi:hypothetical protein